MNTWTSFIYNAVVGFIFCAITSYLGLFWWLISHLASPILSFLLQLLSIPIDLVLASLNAPTHLPAGILAVPGFFWWVLDTFTGENGVRATFGALISFELTLHGLRLLKWILAGMFHWIR